MAVTVEGVAWPRSGRCSLAGPVGLWEGDLLSSLWVPWESDCPQGLCGAAATGKSGGHAGLPGREDGPAWSLAVVVVRSDQMAEISGEPTDD